MMQMRVSKACSRRSPSFWMRQPGRASLLQPVAQTGDILLFGAGDWLTVSTFMGAVLVKTGHDHGLVQAGWQPLWVTDFPMFEWDEDSGRYMAMHHPFTAPAECGAGGAFGQSGRGRCPKAMTWCSTAPRSAEVLSVSIIRQMQQAVFKLLGISEEEAQQKFGFLLDALKYGCPPHGGIAFGLDRIAALMSGEDSIRDVIAFPKTTTAQCLLTSAPSPVPDEQLAELHIRNVQQGQLKPGRETIQHSAERTGHHGSAGRLHSVGAGADLLQTDPVGCRH